MSVIDFTSRVATEDDLPDMDAILEDAKGVYVDAVIVGHDAEGRMHISGIFSIASAALMLERAKLALVTGEDDV